MERTLAVALKPVSVDFRILHQRYNPLLGLVKELIGVIPGCDPILEIWPPGFRTYNLLVPNMLNLPGTLFSSKSFKVAMGLALYASSKAACAYCTAHTCSFALRRGASVQAIAGSRTPAEQAVVNMAGRLASIPTQLTQADIDAVRSHFSATETEWLVYSISMMGFLNKFMNAMGVELEQEAINDTAALLSRTGWSPGIHVSGDYSVTKDSAAKRDNLLTYLRVIKHAPGAVLWEKKWTRGVPTDYPKAAEYLKEHTGYSFPILQSIGQGRVMRTIVCALRDNLSKEQTSVGMKTKMLAACVFTCHAQNDRLSSEVKMMVSSISPGINEEMQIRVAGFSKLELPADSIACRQMLGSIRHELSLTEAEAAAVLLAMGASCSPAQLNNTVIEAVLEVLKPDAIVEIVVWLSVLQMLSRLSFYYTIIKENY